ncbi:ubiquitin carboxyl-terminal hydrolase 14 [Embleya sp. AB8]|uniref:ubiquitin carboxyl-terminal hydrolase 14 n=1 Tax=Embleya sp. AB8 TaxID=3156304 RepID=UPI003C74D76A
MTGMHYQVVQDGTGRPTNAPCAHLDTLPETVEPGSTKGCEDCLRDGTRWVHLRECLTCGHIGCCDSSPNRHATAHWHAAEHPLVRSFEPGEDWAWCYADELLAVPVD